MSVKLCDIMQSFSSKMASVLTCQFSALKIHQVQRLWPVVQLQMKPGKLIVGQVLEKFCCLTEFVSTLITSQSLIPLIHNVINACKLNPKDERVASPKDMDQKELG